MATTLERWQQVYRRWASFNKPFWERKKAKPSSKSAPFLHMERGLEWVFWASSQLVGQAVERLMTRLARRLGSSKP